MINPVKGVIFIFLSPVHYRVISKLKNKPGTFSPFLIGLAEISGSIASMTETERDTLRQALRIGIQWGAKVTLTDCRHTVSQAFCSALPVAYSAHSAALWTDFAELILEASYEATLFAAILNLARTGNNKVFLTALGGGAFGNSPDWIFAAIQRAIRVFVEYPLDVVIVSHAVPNHRIQELRVF